VNGPKAIDSLPADIARRVETVLGRAVRKTETIPPGLDVRRFYRVHLEGDGAPASLIVRLDPEPGSGSDLEPIRALFARHDLPVPRRLGSGPGMELLEDLGDQSLEALSAGAAQRGPLRDRLYAEACALVPRIQAISAPFERCLDHALIASKARKWIDWTLPLALGREANADERSAVGRAFDFVAQACAQAPQRLAHRDFKAANLLLRPASEERPAELCMIDLQGAFLAPPEYDLVCLLRDSQVPLPEEMVQAQLNRIRAALPDAPEADEFQRRFDLIALVRIAKDISHYLRAAAARGDRRYLPFVPTGLAQLRSAAERASSRDGELEALAKTLRELPERIEVPAPATSKGDP
jgi:aminoglycoside/choline kinase family phosphotransferase